MNVLILTPDRVGSTLLQRMLTIYMLRQGFDRPVINLHELTNGLVKYYHTDLNQEVLGKPQGTEWSYYQSLPEVIDLLKSVEHYKTSRLAHYHIVQRQDSINDQMQFYDYLNKNFHIIACKRDNLFEHGLSWCINAHSKVLNVYSAFQKINVFDEIYKNGVTVNKPTLRMHLQNYKSYIEWTERYFNVQSVFNYDQNVHNIEDYILNLDFMKNSEDNTWGSMFGQSFTDFNTCHKLLPDLILQSSETTDPAQLDFYDPIKEIKWEVYKGADWPEFENSNDLQGLPTRVQQEILNFEENKLVSRSKDRITASKEVVAYLNNNIENYKTTYKTLHGLVEKGFLVTSVPIKLQSLKEKKALIKNYQETIDWYNEWVEENNFGTRYEESELERLMNVEEQTLAAPTIPRLT